MNIIPFVVNILLGYVIYTQINQSRDLTKRIDTLESALQPIMQAQKAMMSADVDIEHQIQEIFKQVISMDKQIQALENIRANDGGYQHALHILQMGGTKDEIVNSCHLTNAEAELLMNLQAYREAIK